MKALFAFVVMGHGLVHVIGAAKAFGWAALPQLTVPVPPLRGLLWLGASTLSMATAVAVFAWPRGAWVIGFGAVAVSTLAIVPSWADAKFGMLPNAVMFAGAVMAFYNVGPPSLLAAYERDAAQARAAAGDNRVVSTEDLAKLPPPVARYLTLAGVVGQPRVSNFAVRMHGRIRSDPSSRWMTFDSEQINTPRDGTRLFYLNASMSGLPLSGYHRLVGPAATMEIRALGMVPVQTASGPGMTHGETVTLFNDMCLFAPATLIDAQAVWVSKDDQSVEARFTNGRETIHATLVFADDGRLVNFWSDDRAQLLPDGQMRRLRWSTPLGTYRSFGSAFLSSSGAALWRGPDGEFAYVEATIDEVRYNVSDR